MVDRWNSAKGPLTEDLPDQFQPNVLNNSTLTFLCYAVEIGLNHLRFSKMFSDTFTSQNKNQAPIKF